MQTAVINGIEMAYHDVGTGAALLLIHGFPLDSTMWQAQIDDFARSYRVIAPDLRGFGASAASEGAVSMEQYADDLAVLLDHLDIAKAALCGVSMGGYIAFAFWRRHRAKVSALILADTRAGADTAEGKAGREQNAQMVEGAGAPPLANQMLPRLLAQAAPAALVEQVRSIIERHAPASLAAALRAMAVRDDSTQLLADVDVPTLVIVGENDALTPPDEARRLQSGISGSQLIEIPGAAHLANVEAPAAFNNAVHTFLNDALAFHEGGGGGGVW